MLGGVEVWIGRLDTHTLHDVGLALYELVQQSCVMLECCQLDAASAVSQNTVLHQSTVDLPHLALALHHHLDAVPVHHVAQAVHSVSGISSPSLSLGWRATKALLKFPLDSLTIMTGSSTVLGWRWHHLGLRSRAGQGRHGFKMPEDQ